MTDQTSQTWVPARFPVSVIVERRELKQGEWAWPSWKVVAVVAGADLGAGKEQRALVRSQGGVDQYIWTGFELELHKSDAESYWYNLVAEKPSLFVMCEQEGDELIPILVTANYDEVGRHTEAEGTSFAVPIPPEVHEWLEQYVMENYVPDEPKKRKKEKWFETSTFGRGRESKEEDR